MRFVVESPGTMIEGEVIGGELLDCGSRLYDLGSEFTVRCDDGVSFTVNGWLVGVEVLKEPAKWVM